MLPGFNMGNMDEIMGQAKGMQEKMAKFKEDLSKRVYDGQSGGGVIKAFVDGNKKLIKLEIDESSVDPEDVDMLQDMIIAAVNSALQLAKDETKDEMDKIMGGMGSLLSDMF